MAGPIEPVVVQNEGTKEGRDKITGQCTYINRRMKR